MSATPITIHAVSRGDLSADGALSLQGLDRFRLEWLVSFVAVARYGGVLAAARHLYRSQPRVSCHISDLESALGTVLLDRSIRPVALTPAGAALLPQAESILSGVRLLATASQIDLGSRSTAARAS